MAIIIADLVVKHLKNSLRWVIKLWRSLVCMHEDINENFFDFIVLGDCKSFDKIFGPYFSMIFLNIR